MQAYIGAVCIESYTVHVDDGGVGIAHNYVVPNFRLGLHRQSGDSKENGDDVFLHCVILFLFQILCHPQHPRVDVVGELLGIRQGDDNVGLVAGIPQATLMLEDVIDRCGIAHGDVAMGQTNLVAVACLLTSQGVVATIHLGVGLRMVVYKAYRRLGCAGTIAIDDDGSLAHHRLHLATLAEANPIDETTILSCF